MHTLHLAELIVQLMMRAVAHRFPSNGPLRRMMAAHAQAALIGRL